MEGLARWLDKVSPLSVKVVENGETLQAGVVHLSPGTAHLTIKRHDNNLVAKLVKEWGDYRYQPSIDVLFQSVAETCGGNAAGIILTGMGDDGASGLLALRRAGGRTYAQDKKSATVYGMPSVAIDKGAVDEVLPLGSLASAIMKLL